MSFHDILFPLRVGFGAKGGPRRRTQVVTTGTGHEERNTSWADSRRRWDVGTGIRDMREAEEVAAFFEGRRGRLYAFRFRDPIDHKSCALRDQPQATDQTLARADGTRRTFQLIKSYDVLAPYPRPITHPVAGSVLVAVNGAPATGWTVDHSTGAVTFDVAPADGAIVSAGFAFDVPVRFDTDDLDLEFHGGRLAAVPSVPVVEVRA